MIADREARDLVRRGYFHVDTEGAVWRMMTRSRTGRAIAIEPTRADYVDKSTGYRRIRVGKRGSISAHRLVWFATFGVIPDGFEVNHKNLDKADNRPDNLELLSHAANVQHAFAAGVVPAMRGERNGQSKLTESDVVEIRALVASGKAKRAIARRFQITPTLVRHIVSGRAWKHAAFPSPNLFEVQ